jgi:hypothetical protein
LMNCQISQLPMTQWQECRYECLHNSAINDRFGVTRPVGRLNEGR